MKDCATRVEAALQAIIGKHEDLQKTMQALQKRVTDLTNSKQSQNERAAQDRASTANTDRGEDLDVCPFSSPPNTAFLQDISRSSASASTQPVAIPRSSATAAMESHREVHNVKKPLL